MSQSSSIHRVVRVLMALGDGELGEVSADFVVECAGSDISVVVHTCPDRHEASIRTLAHMVCFDVCFLTLNNVKYTRHEPKNARLQSSVTLVHDLVQLYAKPVVAFFGWPDDPEYPERILAAGATALFYLPFELQPLRELLIDELDLPR